MSATDFTVGDALPRIAAVSAHDGFTITVTWTDGRVEPVDLAPAVFRYKIYAPLRADPRLFASIHVSDDGFAVAWGDDEVDMASTTIEDLAGQAMTAADFGAFMKRRGYTLDSVAAELGISRRLAAYYAGGRSIPRYIALACAHLDGAATAVRKSRQVGGDPAQAVLSAVETLEAKLAEATRLIEGELREEAASARQVTGAGLVLSGKRRIRV